MNIFPKFHTALRELERWKYEQKPKFKNFTI